MTEARNTHTTPFFGQIISYDGKTITVQNMDSEKTEDWSAIPNVTARMNNAFINEQGQTGPLKTGDWFGALLEVRGSEIVGISDIGKGEAPRTGKLTDEERAKLIARHLKLAAGLTKGPLADTPYVERVTGSTDTDELQR